MGTSGGGGGRRSVWAVLVVVALLAGAGGLVGVRTAVAGEGVVELAPSGRPPEQLPPELVACRERVHAGELVASAMRSMADNWQLTSQGADRNPRDRTISELRASVTITLPVAEADVERLEAARVGYDDRQGSCGDLLDAAVGSRGAEAEVCIARTRAVRAVVAAGNEVEEDWRSHIALMQTVLTADPDEYLVEWRDQVDHAEDSLVPFREATAELDRTPRCVIG